CFDNKDPVIKELGLEQLGFIIDNQQIRYALWKQVIHQHNVEVWLPLLEQNNRSYLTIAIGCTGGKHRSVFVAEKLARYIESKGKKVRVRHCSLEKHYKTS
ncbi:hypothetical protein NUQ34_09945, partial [Glaesserella parasuis]|nr:hypothetical protein [Glaesserella parasuis]